MLYQTLKYVFIRVGLSFLLLLTFGFFTLYFIHEVALPGVAFDDSFVQWLLLFVCVFFGFFAYGLIGDQRFYNAMHEFKDISYDADPEKIIDGFQSVLDFTYSSYFLPGQGRRLRSQVVAQFADYLLFAGREDVRAQKIYLKAFLLHPKDSPYRAPLLSILSKGGDLTPQEIDLLLVILKAEEFCDDVIVSHLASLFLRKRLFTRKTEPVYLAALESGSEDSEGIVGFVLPRLLENRRSDKFALKFYIRALPWKSPGARQAREIAGRVFCEGHWKGIDLLLHQKCEEAFSQLDLERRTELMREVEESRFSGKIRKIRLFTQDDLRQLERLKERLGISKSFLDYFREAFWGMLHLLKKLAETLVLKVLDGVVAFGRLDLRTRFIALLVVVVLLITGLSYRGWQAQREEAARLEQEAQDHQAGRIPGGKPELKIHTLQVAAFTSSKQAERLTRSLQKKGVRGTYMVKSNRKTGGSWYKIRVGRFDSKEEARQFASQLIDQKTIRNYFIISLPVN
ncbi:MAG: SPOR domain-containing protein [Nitrospinae bacterium]|nr:SPOR domain-containing protein [Nitrospinota bacterium]